MKRSVLKTSLGPFFSDATRTTTANRSYSFALDSHVSATVISATNSNIFVSGGSTTFVYKMESDSSDDSVIAILVQLKKDRLPNVNIVPIRLITSGGNVASSSTDFVLRKGRYLLASGVRFYSSRNSARRRQIIAREKCCLRTRQNPAQFRRSPPVGEAAAVGCLRVGAGVKMCFGAMAIRK